jgi:hypothetical protein
MSDQNATPHAVSQGRNDRSYIIGWSIRIMLLAAWS